MPIVRRSILSAFAAGVATIAPPTITLGEPSVTIDIAQLRFATGVNQTRSSAPSTVDPAFRYAYEVDPETTVRGGSGLLAILYPSPILLADFLAQAGVEDVVLGGAGNNPSGTHPTSIAPQTITGTGNVLGTGITITMTVAAGTDAAGVASFNVTNVTISPAIVGSLQVVQGNVRVTALCRSDYNNDQGVTIDDLLLYLDLFSAGDVLADIDADDAVTIDDLLLYLPAFFDGC